ncbi:MAG TPA: RagB/SusD family nutrient uptake outer membrane protein [Puia sp.]|nr:RagB/SusD family nutrient uptake outer membrane protein [Puia sp.]
MQMAIPFWRWLIVSGALLAAPACKKNLAVDPPQDQMTAGKVFADDEGAEAAMTGYYLDAMNAGRAFLNGGISLDAGLAADELDCTPPYPRDDSFRLNEVLPMNPINANFFSTAYRLLLDVNSVLAGVAGSTGMTVPVKAELRGEAEFHRALLYFHLVNLYGPVPLVVETNYQVNEKLARVSVDSVYAQMVADLRDASGLLPADYLAATGYAGNRTRPNRAAALALLARVELYLGRWAAADSAASVVIGDGRYGLEPSLDSIFLATSREAIWQLQPVRGITATADGQAFLSLQAAGRPGFFLTPQLLAAFEPGDARQTHWIRKVVYKGVTYFTPYKYKQLVSAADAEYEMVLRLAEQYLIRAEARAQEGDVAGGLADLNGVRARAGLGAVTVTEAGDLLAAIGRERRIELFCEWGHRWMDLKRSGQATAVLGPLKSGWQGSDVLWPIPAAELAASPGMAQNPGY